MYTIIVSTFVRTVQPQQRVQSCSSRDTVTALRHCPPRKKQTKKLGNNKTPQKKIPAIPSSRRTAASPIAATPPAHTVLCHATGQKKGERATKTEYEVSHQTQTFYLRLRSRRTLFVRGSDVFRPQNKQGVIHVIMYPREGRKEKKQQT